MDRDPTIWEVHIVGEFLDSARIMVTGGAGFIGSNFVRHVMHKHGDLQVVVLDKLTYAGNLDNLAGLDENRLTFVRGDICDAEVVARCMQGCDAALNFAAETHVDRSIQNPGSFVQTDVYGSYVLLEAAKRLELKRFIQISTDEVYGEVLGEPVTEEAALMPRNPYSASKAGADRLAYSYFTTYDLPVTITRCSNNYGPYQHVEKLWPLFVTNALEDKALPVYGTGTNLRDWIYVEDHCEALRQILCAEDVEGEVFNIGAENEHSSLEIGKLIVETLDKPAELITHIKDRPGHDRRYALNCDKIRKQLGWSPQTDFRRGAERTIQWYSENREWWEKLKGGEFKEYYEKAYDL
jgi:dTDP-glucose 4,6-dehydratase